MFTSASPVAMKKPLVSRLGRRLAAGGKALPNFCPLDESQRASASRVAVHGSTEPRSTVQWPSWLVALLFGTNIVLGVAGPILLSWIKDQHGGRYGFSTAALAFHAYTFSAALGIFTTTLQGGPGALARLNRPDMVWRFCCTASLFTAGDMLSFSSMLYLDPGLFSLVGKALGIVVTVVFSRILLRKNHTPVQYALVFGVALSTLLFCWAEMQARSIARAGSLGAGGASFHAGRMKAGLSVGIALRAASVLLTAGASVLQERFLALEPGLPFMLQQCWMACGALTTSLLAFRLVHHMHPSQLYDGFNDWRVGLLLAFQVANGLCAGLMVKKLGALTRALCVPITLGGCYLYAVLVGIAALEFKAVAAWITSTCLIVAFVVSKAMPSSKGKEELLSHAASV